MAIEEQSASMEEIAASCQSLAKMAEDLQGVNQMTDAAKSILVLSISVSPSAEAAISKSIYSDGFLVTRFAIRHT